MSWTSYWINSIRIGDCATAAVGAQTEFRVRRLNSLGWMCRYVVNDSSMCRAEDGYLCLQKQDGQNQEAQYVNQWLERREVVYDEPGSYKLQINSKRPTWCQA